MALSNLMSVIVPFSMSGNRRNSLGEWLDEALGNSIEVIVVIDGDTSENFEAISAVKKNITSPKLKIVTSSSKGPGGARNIGLDVATNHYVAFWDSDDLPLVTEFLRMKEKLEQTDFDCAIGDFIWEDETGHSAPKRNGFKGDFLTSIARNPGIWRMVFRRDSLSSVVFPETSMAEDQVFLTRYNLADRNILKSELVVYKYRFGNNFHLTKQKSALKELKLSRQEILKDFSNKTPRERAFESILVLKQFISEIKMGSFTSRIKAILQLLSLLLAGKKNSRTTFLKNFVKFLQFSWVK